MQSKTGAGEGLGTRLEGSRMRKNTRLSPYAQVQFLVLEQRSLGTRLAKEVVKWRVGTRYSLTPRLSQLRRGEPGNEARLHSLHN